MADTSVLVVVMPIHNPSANSSLMLRDPIDENVAEQSVSTMQMIRDYILESINRGVMVLPIGASYRTEQFPDLGGVEVSAAPALAVKAEAVDLPSTVREKRLIMERLTAYREKHGLGCLAEVAKKYGKGITDDILRRLLSGNATATLAEWRRIGEALNKLEEKQG